MSGTSVGDRFLLLCGPTALKLRNSFVLLVVLVVALAAAGVVPNLFLSDDEAAAGWVAPVLTGAALVGVLVTAIDRIADAYERLDHDDQVEAANKTAAALLSIVAEYLTGGPGHVVLAAGRSGQTMSFLAQRLAVEAAARMVAGGDGRGAYFELSVRDSGRRQLTRATHAGRASTPRLAFKEEDDPNSGVWSALNAPDDQAVRHSLSDPDAARWGPWDMRDYQAFLSVPVQMNGVTFGLLTLDTTTVDAINQQERLALLTVARTLAVALSAATGPTKLRQLGARDPSAC